MHQTILNNLAKELCAAAYLEAWIGPYHPEWPIMSWPSPERPYGYHGTRLAAVLRAVLPVRYGGEGGEVVKYGERWRQHLAERALDGSPIHKDYQEELSDAGWANPRRKEPFPLGARMREVVTTLLQVATNLPDRCYVGTWKGRKLSRWLRGATVCLGGRMAQQHRLRAVRALMLDLHAHLHESACRSLSPRWRADVAHVMRVSHRRQTLERLVWDLWFALERHLEQGGQPMPQSPEYSSCSDCDLDPCASRSDSPLPAYTAAENEAWERTRQRAHPASDPSLRHDRRPPPTQPVGDPESNGGRDKCDCPCAKWGVLIHSGLGACVNDAAGPGWGVGFPSRCLLCQGDRRSDPQSNLCARCACDGCHPTRYTRSCWDTNGYSDKHGRPTFYEYFKMFDDGAWRTWRVREDGLVCFSAAARAASANEWTQGRLLADPREAPARDPVRRPMPVPVGMPPALPPRDGLRAMERWQHPHEEFLNCNDESIYRQAHRALGQPDPPFIVDLWTANPFPLTFSEEEFDLFAGHMNPTHSDMGQLPFEHGQAVDLLRRAERDMPPGTMAQDWWITQRFWNIHIETLRRGTHHVFNQGERIEAVAVQFYDNVTLEAIRTAEQGWGRLNSNPDQPNSRGWVLPRAWRDDMLAASTPGERWLLMYVLYQSLPRRDWMRRRPEPVAVPPDAPAPPRGPPPPLRPPPPPPAPTRARNGWGNPVEARAVALRVQRYRSRFIGPLRGRVAPAPTLVHMLLDASWWLSDSVGVPIGAG